MPVEGGPGATGNDKHFIGEGIGQLADILIRLAIKQIGHQMKIEMGDGTTIAIMPKVPTATLLPK